MHPELSRRTLLLTTAAGGVAAWAGLPALSAAADPLVYDSPEAFDVAQAGYLASNAQNNEAGLYAWGESYFLLALLRMYEAYQDERYLRTFEDRARHLMKTTDHARHVKDYAGRSGKVWRTAGNYTAGHGVLPDGNGTPAIQLRWAGIRSAESTAEVLNVADGTFDLVLRNPATTTVVTLPAVSLDPASPTYVVTAVNNAYNASLRWTAVDLRTAPAAAPAPAATTIAFKSQYYVFAVHTGMIAFPLARYARMVAAVAQAPAQSGVREGGSGRGDRGGRVPRPGVGVARGRHRRLRVAEGCADPVRRHHPAVQPEPGHRPGAGRAVPRDQAAALPDPRAADAEGVRARAATRRRRLRLDLLAAVQRAVHRVPEDRGRSRSTRRRTRRRSRSRT